MSASPAPVVLVADSSPLIVFARVEQLAVLWAVTGGVVVPRTVWRECAETADRPGAPALQQARAQGLLPAVAPVLARMKTEGYFLSDALVREVLQRVGEAV